MKIQATCETCGKSFSHFPSRGHVRFCSRSCYDKHGPNNPKWRGGRFLCDGYVYLYQPEHPNRTKAGYVVEHRLVMEDKVGRFLERQEAVHHINGITTDNRIENLVLCQSNGRHSADHHPKQQDGEANKMAKFTTQQIEEMKRKFRSGVKRKVIAFQYEISLSHLCNVLAGKDRKHC